MKIIHVIDTLDPASGGPCGVAIRLAAAQTALGHQVHVVSYAAAGSEQRFAAAIARVPGVSAVGLDYIGRASYAERLLPMSARRMLERLMIGADFVHLHGIWEPVLRAAAGAARERGVPYCICPHGMLDPWSLSQKPLKKKIALWLGLRDMVDSAAFVHALNADEARLLGPLKLLSPVCIVPNGVFMEEMEPRVPKGVFGMRCTAVAGKPFILFMARLHYKKGLDHLGRAFVHVAQQRPEVHLVVAGPDDGAQSSFEAAIGREGLSDRVHVVGPLYGTEKLAALNDAACFCLPSRQEGFSVAILEALAVGLPVVASEQCHFDQVATAGAGEIVPLSGRAIGDALLRVLSDPGRRSEMARAARKLVRRDYIWPRIAEHLMATYERFRGASRSRTNTGSRRSDIARLG